MENHACIDKKIRYWKYISLEIGDCSFFPGKNENIQERLSQIVEAIIFSASPEVRLENLLELRNPHQRQRFPVKKADIVLVVVQLGHDFVPSEEGEGLSRSTSYFSSIHTYGTHLIHSSQLESG